MASRNQRNDEDWAARGVRRGLEAWAEEAAGTKRRRRDRVKQPEGDRSADSLDSLGDATPTFP